MDEVQQNELTTPITREQLYDLVWKEPMLKIAGRFGVSSSYLARVCTLMRVPRPQRGYWAKLEVGKKVPKTELPEPKPTDQLVWSRDGDPPLKLPTVLPVASEPRARVTRVSKVLGQHPLLIGAQPLFEAGRTSHWEFYLKPAKRNLVDIVATRDGLARVFEFTNKLFLALEANEHSVSLAPADFHFGGRNEIDEREVIPKRGSHYNKVWRPGRYTVAYFGTVAIALTIVEMSEDVPAVYVNGGYVRDTALAPSKRGRHSYGLVTTHAFGSGRLRLVAQAPYYDGVWTRTWQEKPGSHLENNLPAIISELESGAVEIQALTAQGEQRRQQQQLQWEEEARQGAIREDRKRRERAIRLSTKELLKAMDSWNQAMVIQRFLEQASSVAQRLPPAECARLLERVTLATELVGGQDSLAALSKWRTPTEFRSLIDKDPYANWEAKDSDP